MNPSDPRSPERPGKYLYFLRDNGLGAPYEIYRAISRKLTSDAQLERAKRNGTWSGADADVRSVVNDWLRGDFCPIGDEISEEFANELLRTWRRDFWGWPGRP